MFSYVDLGDLENTLPSWILTHLGEQSYMTTEVTQYPSSSREDSSDSEESPSIDTRPPPERETNIMTQRKLDCLLESCSFPFGIQIRLPKADEIIASTRPSEFFLRILALESEKMMSSGGDNAEENHTSDVTHVVADEGESHLSRDGLPRAMSKKIDIKKLAQMTKERAKPKGATLVGAVDVKKKGSMPSPNYKEKGPATKAPAKPKATLSRAATRVVPAFTTPEEGTSANPGVILGLKAFVIENPAVAEKLLQGGSGKVGSQLGDHEVAELEAEKQHAVEELRRMKEEHVAALERHEKEMAEMREKEALIKRYYASAVEEFKSSDDFKETMEKAASLYFGEGFDLCKKQIGFFYPNLDIQDLPIDPDLVKEDEEEEKDGLDTNPLSQ
ncbi:hypothetical protein Acr_08g0000580 [Actinidia rufa]|uniref:Uncharacterized protein n=1 Tax=Actinidia rufa TaxID=165716 RepID=A0A7J0EZ01_9ERIC|nr:hypothetical protein Acr_08g0000580 [Actinidia rufa]